jgi:hypothetical protein
MPGFLQYANKAYTQPYSASRFSTHKSCPANDERRGACPGYVVDHIKPLCAGGDDSVDNMQWQEYSESLMKDKVERMMCRDIRDLNH